MATLAAILCFLKVVDGIVNFLLWLRLDKLLGLCMARFKVQAPGSFSN